MKIEPGQELSHYRLVEQIGEGGMGVVWRAVDTTLGRDVAIKLLPEAFSADQDRLTRFEQEAKLLASLNHPHIATIHGMHQAEGVHFLAMEMVTGEDLSERIAREPLALSRVIEIATQIAEALEAAHGQGVIHRDLKPANIRLNEDGKVKVLDFGLAKAMMPEQVSGSGPVSMSLSPTMTSAGTIAGVILGTAAYMSPEQARGKPVDRRADIWALGCLMYEMLTGSRAFEGETISDTLASVLKVEPDFSALPEGTPPTIRRLIRRCLAKNPRYRLRDAADARIELAEATEAPFPGEQTLRETDGETTQIKSSRMPWLIAAAATILAISVWMIPTTETPEPNDPIRLTISLPPGLSLEIDQETNLAVSPDGQRVVFVGRNEEGVQLYSRQLDDTAVVPVPGSANGGSPFFSPDGRWVAFFANNELIKVSIDNGTAVTIGPVNGEPRGASWGADDRIIFPQHFNTGLMVINASGGTPTVLTELDEANRERTHRWPQIIPGRNLVLFTVATKDSPEFYDDADIDLLDLTTGKRTTIYENAAFARYLPTGHLLLGRDGQLFAVPFDIDQLKITGTPLPVVDHVRGARVSGVYFADFSSNGLLAYIAGEAQDRSEMVSWYFLDGSGSKPLPGLPIGGYIDSVQSPSGDRVAITVSDGGVFNIWIYEVSSQNMTRLTFDGSNMGPVWTPDDKQIIFNGVRDGVGSVYIQLADGSEPEQLLHTIDGVTIGAEDVSHDGKWVTLNVFADNRSDVFLKSLVDPKAELISIVETEANELQADFSPDGRWIAYCSDELSTYEVFVRPSDGRGGRWQVSRDGGSQPRWTPDGKRLLFLRGTRLYAAEVISQPGATIRFSTPRILIEGLDQAALTRSYGVTPDSSAVVITHSAGGGASSDDRITIVLHWFEALRRRLDAL